MKEEEKKKQHWLSLTHSLLLAVLLEVLSLPAVAVLLLLLVLLTGGLALRDSAMRRVSALSGPWAAA